MEDANSKHETADEPKFGSTEAALSHYKDLCASLSRQLTEANDDIRDYTESSKELQDELEKELSRMEKSESEMRKVVEDARGEIDSWKSKYTATLREHTTTITHMQRELESLRSSEHSLRTSLRDLEMNNDDLEKSDREKDSSLQDLETRYGKSIERIALLEEGLVSKAKLDEELQRIKDELREAEEELAVLRSRSTTTRPMSSQNVHLVPEVLPAPPSEIGETKQHRPPSSDGHSVEGQPVSKVALEADSALDNVIASSHLISKAPASTKSRRRSLIPARQITNDGFGYARSTTPTSALDYTTVSSAFVTPRHNNPLSRSVKTHNLASTAAISSPISVIPHARPGSRQRRTDGMFQDMKEMTSRVRQLTSRLDSRRNLVMAGSSIPRASMSPTSSSGMGGLARSSSLRRLATEEVEDGSIFGLLAAPTPAPSTSHYTRPPSRTSLRMSTDGSRSMKTSIPVRPPSRLSSLSASVTNAPRAPTPTFSTRSSTPSSSLSGTYRERPAWGATAPSKTANSLGASTQGRAPGSSAGLNNSTRRRVSSATLAHAGIVKDHHHHPPLPPGAAAFTAELNQSQRPTSETTYLGIGKPMIGNGIARRVSLAPKSARDSLNGVRQ